jgi:alkyl sulfatase BDS1-like metallo-beta-lactamase superfamily hydrolase
MKKYIFLLFFVLLSTTIFAETNSSSAATKHTKKINSELKKQLNFKDTKDYDDVSRGFIAGFDAEQLTYFDKDTSSEKIAWDFASYSFLTGQSPDTVNPSLWRNAILNNYSGLFKVADQIYQVRGADLSNMTIIEAPKGLIIVDVMTSPVTAKASLDLYYKHRPYKPIIAVIYTHSHGDHFGGIKGIVNEQDVKNGKIKIYAPEGFLEHAISENLYAGNAMTRRAMYSYGNTLPVGVKGQVDGGLGKTLPVGDVTLIAPNIIVTKNKEVFNIGGMKVEFYLALGTEAPSEMFMYFPELKMIQGAEVVSHTLHNLYTLRGAQVRDATAWWKAINAMIDEYTDQAEIITASHHWPIWGQKNIISYLENQRDIYKAIHDQTLYYANKGYSPIEIVEKINIPSTLAMEWYNRGYYGSISHNVKAVYQRYLGWYDGHPSNLNPISQKEEAKKYVEGFGGIDKTINLATTAYENGEYRWAATVLKHAVFADPSNQKAKSLLAKVYDQLGYIAESATWRNIYLMGAYELRHGKTNKITTTTSSDLLIELTPEMFLDYLAISSDPTKYNDINIDFNITFKDIKKDLGVSIRNSVITYSSKHKKNPNFTIVLDKLTFNKIILKEVTLEDALKNKDINISGDYSKLEIFAKKINLEKNLFDIVTP